MTTLAKRTGGDVAPLHKQLSRTDGKLWLFREICDGNEEIQQNDLLYVAVVMGAYSLCPAKAVGKVGVKLRDSKYHKILRFVDNDVVICDDDRTLPSPQT